MQTNTEIAFFRKGIEQTFDSSEIVVYSRAEVFRTIQEHQEQWQVEQGVEAKKQRSKAKNQAVLVAKSSSVTDVLQMLLTETELQQISLPFPHRATVRYTWREVPTLQILQTVDDNAYFSHFTAMRLHGLTEQIPKTTYLNVEQRATGGGGVLTQAAIDRAFKGKCRTTNNQTTFRNLTICKLNGQNTGQLGVVSLTLDEGYSVRVTNLERTLIDATVRPVYSGGTAEVAKAYRAAAEHLSVNKLVAYLRKLNFTYPYHQAIGFYLEQSGRFKASQIDLLRDFPIEFDFYLTYQMKDSDYNERWRLFVPKGL